MKPPVKTLIEVLPHEFKQEFADTRAWEMREVEVVKAYHDRPCGWSFPVQKLPKGFVP